MGCFSFICKKSGKPGNSTSFQGNPVHLFLLRKGKVIEHMFGNYDSYGRVFSKEKDPKDSSLTETTSFEWKLPWLQCCDLIDNNDKSNGIALIHGNYWQEGDKYPTERSQNDPNQGWGNCTTANCETVDEPFHKIIK